IGSSLGKEINDRADRSEKQDDVQPIGIRPTTNKVHDRQGLEQNAPRKKKRAKNSHGKAQYSTRFLGLRLNRFLSHYVGDPYLGPFKSQPQEVTGQSNPSIA